MPEWLFDFLSGPTIKIAEAIWNSSMRLIIKLVCSTPQKFSTGTWALKYKKCKSCGKKWTDVIRRTPALGHKPGKVKILKPGCTSVGYKTTNCTRKGCMNSYGGAEDGYLTVETIPALGHSYDKGTSIKIGKKRGGKMKYQKTQKCKRCGKRKISYYYK